MSITRCICLEIDRWKKDHKDDFELDFLNLQNYICWTSQGKIDRIKSAKSLINDENLPICKSFNIARHYCFVADVITLLEKMNKVDKFDSSRLGARPWFEYRKNRTDKKFVSH
ncbi:hypothetical protein TNIN_414671 [Trichonephila inaurata madagascariensis]|uniref:Uncharacterized protein n=1 Tax=Trichonephila inaurata madagascariensis TaxID=2747483 RepID=A0A8X6M8V6_9ARAC|nr:hypothetical protein TNIN_414671 [Trichonephila inaurata madagascariensis]